MLRELAGLMEGKNFPRLGDIGFLVREIVKNFPPRSFVHRRVLILGDEITGVIIFYRSETLGVSARGR